MNNNLVLGLVLVLIVGSIVYLESQKVKPLPIAQSSTDQQAILEERAQGDAAELQRLEEKAKKYPLAPELAGIAGYLNTEEGLRLSDLKGKVVLIDFWTYTCINCIRTLPHLTNWDRKYRDQGFVIIGVHTPEFEFEKEYDNVQLALDKYNIEYPVVQDNDYVTWRAFQNRYWPHKYLIDGDGFIRYHHIGEGAYAETERQIQSLLSELGEDLTGMDTSDLEDKTPRVRTTPELYAGHRFALPRGQDIGNTEGLQPGVSFTYTLPDSLQKDVIYLEGEWTSSPEELQAMGDASIVLSFLATSVNIVADAPAPLKMAVFIDDEPITEERAGTDVIFEDGKAFVLVDEPLLYNVVKGAYGRSVLRLDVEEGFVFNAFTFG